MPLAMTCDRCEREIPPDSQGGVLRFILGSTEWKKHYLCINCLNGLDTLTKAYIYNK